MSLVLGHKQSSSGSLILNASSVAKSHVVDITGNQSHKIKKSKENFILGTSSLAKYQKWVLILSPYTIIEDMSGMMKFLTK